MLGTGQFQRETATACPVAAIAPESELVVPRARSILCQRSASDEGAPQITLYTPSNEIVFDDPRHFAFAENLARQSRFRAGDAAGWGDIGWVEAAGMLGALIDERIIAPADAAASDAERHDNRPYASPLPPAPMVSPRCWSADGASLMRDLTGSALDMGYLEVVVPVFRVAHLFLDRDGRQVGEANVFPAAARVEVPTDWRGCPYPGNRHQPEKPMNASALRAMRAHWRQMMALLLRIRGAYLDRFPAARAGWTVGDVERMATAVLALPSFLLLRRDGAVANGDLHPALSNLFRVTDGLRLVMHQMLFVPLHETMLHADAPVTTARILAYADRNYAFHSDHAVCAGPRFMIEDFLGVIIDGTPPRGGMDSVLEPELEAAAALIDPAIDYAMHGLRTHFATFALWPAMTRTYETLHRILDARRGNGPGVAALADRFAAHFASMGARSFLSREEWRRHREHVYDAIFARCGEAVEPGHDEPPLSAQVAGATLRHPETADLEHRIAIATGGGAATVVAPLAAAIMDFLHRAQRIVALAERTQAGVNRCLGRPAPAHRLTLDHINLHNVLMGEDLRTLPFLPSEIGAILGIAIHVDAETIVIRAR